MNMTVEELRKLVEDKKYRLHQGDIDNLCVWYRNHIIATLGEKVLNHKGAWQFKDGTDALSRCSRVVVGAHGPYVEFDVENSMFKMYVPDDQRWRLSGGYNCKYVHKQPIGRNEKIYLQMGLVGYADYLVGKHYIDLYLLNALVVELADTQR